MSSKDLEKRLTALEKEVADLKEKLGEKKTPWWKAIVGQFENDPYYEEAMKLGRQYRESTRPKGKKKQGKNGHS